MSGWFRSRRADNAAVGYGELAGVIERFLDGTSPDWEWDDYFLGTTYGDPFFAPRSRTDALGILRVSAGTRGRILRPGRARGPEGAR